MFMNILLALAALVVVFVIIVATRPADFRVVRSATVFAPAAEVFEQVNDLHKWEAWSPWGKLDPAMKQSYEGPPAGVGAIYHWAGNSQVGEGSTTITESRPNDLIRMKLEFLKPFAGTNDVEFTFKPAGDHTVLTWSMSGKYNFVTKAVGLFISCEKMVGGQFDEGLAQLKSVVEAKSGDGK